MAPVRVAGKLPSLGRNYVYFVGCEPLIKFTLPSINRYLRPSLAVRMGRLSDKLGRFDQNCTDELIARQFRFAPALKFFITINIASRCTAKVKPHPETDNYSYYI
jgi:hypothetical protein